MTPDDDQLLEALARLPSITPDIEREALVRARCHAELSRRASRRAQAGRDLFTVRLVDLAATTALVVYMAAVLLEAARLGGSL
jgi:hypothetical protein